MLFVVGSLLLWLAICQGLEIGWTASMHNWPFVAALYTGTSDKKPWEVKPFCTGTIITERIVLTTAGCLYQQHPYREARILDFPTEIWVWVGATTGYVNHADNLESQYLQVSEVTVPSIDNVKDTLNIQYPEKYSKNEFNSGDRTYFLLDFAAVELKKFMLWNRFVQPVRFDHRAIEAAIPSFTKWKDDLDSEKEWIPDCFLAGWGYEKHDEWDDDAFHDSERVEPRRQRLTYTRVKFTPKTHCDLALCTNCSLCSNSTENLPYLYWCFTSYLRGDTCPGDQGGPLYCNWFGYKTKEGSQGAILGILSVRPGTCNEVNLPLRISTIWYAYNFLEEVVDRGKFPPPPVGTVPELNWD